MTPQQKTSLASTSIVVPIHNEYDNIPLLYEQVVDALEPHQIDWELVLVDDGSTDNSMERMLELTQSDARVKIVELRRNFGQTAAMQAGLDYAQKEVVITMDGDLQNDPTDIPMMLEKISEGYDLVHGWRKNRQDAFINRKLPSRIANWLISRTTQFPIHDLGCTLKAIRKEIAEDLELYGEMHRFIPILAHRNGARCIEVVTQHHARRFGETKYGIGRTTRVVLDLLTVNFILRYFDSPMKIFGRIGLWCLVAASISGMLTIGMKLLSQVDMSGNPLLLQTVLLIVVGTQFFSLGILGEVMARIYYSQPDQRNYKIRNIHSSAEPESLEFKNAA